MNDGAGQIMAVDNIDAHRHVHVQLSLTGELHIPDDMSRRELHRIVITHIYNDIVSYQPFIVSKGCRNA
jgi:hypothetical protein